MSSPEFHSIFLANTNHWTNDEQCTQCHHCQRLFTMMTRKHHCRYCGHIFCRGCIQKMNVPNYIDLLGQSGLGQTTSICDECYAIIDDQIRRHDALTHLLQSPPRLDTLSENHPVRNDYLEYLRSMQYYLPNHEFTSVEKTVLDVNHPLFVGHSKYLMQWLKSIEWTPIEADEDEFVTIECQVSTTQIKAVLDMLNTPVQCQTCQWMGCTRSCQPTLSYHECIILIHSRHQYLPKVIVDRLFDIIYQQSENVIYAYLSVWVNIIRTAHHPYILTWMYHLVSRTPRLLNAVYWMLCADKEQLTSNIYPFFQLWNADTLAAIRANFSFFQSLVQEDGARVKLFLTMQFSQYPHLYLPFRPSVQLVRVLVDEIITKTSKTNPMIIPFVTQDGHVIRLLFKKETVRNDMCVLNLIQLMDDMLSDELHMNFESVIYAVLPITATSGVIEIVENADTIYSIHKSGGTILQYIMRHNENDLVHTMLDRYTHSLVLYTLHSYFIGIADRHLENIMITTDGRLFHIDFGYILGKDTTPIKSSDIRINTGMLDVIYGKSSARYAKYKDLCMEAVVIVRKYYHDYFLLLSQLPSIEMDLVEQFLVKRFQIRQPDVNIRMELDQVIERSQHMMDTFHDFLHYHTQEHSLASLWQGIIQMRF